MNHRITNSLFGVSLIILVLLGGSANAAPQGEPVIAPEIGRLISEQGIDAARQRFTELAESPSLDFNLETQGMMTLMSAYMQAGNNEAAEAVAEMNAQMMQKMLSGTQTMYPAGMSEIMAELQQAEQAADAQRRAGIEEDRRMQEKATAQSRGRSRDDLQRFVGLYGEPKREIFVTVSCDGYLVTGPMWADVGPWWMRSAADKVFTYADSWQSFSMEFEADGNGRILRMRHEIEGVPSPMQHSGGLPDGWGDCLERPSR